MEPLLAKWKVYELEVRKMSEKQIRVDEVAVAIQGPTVGRHIEELDEFYVDVPASHAKRLKKLNLDPIEQEILDELIRLHRQEDHFWGR